MKMSAYVRHNKELTYCTYLLHVRFLRRPFSFYFVFGIVNRPDQWINFGNLHVIIKDSHDVFTCKNVPFESLIDNASNLGSQMLPKLRFYVQKNF